MTPPIAEAIAVLRTYNGTHLVRRYYSRSAKFADACMTALPTFEYPDWDWRPISKLILHAERKLHEQSGSSSGANVRAAQAAR